MSHKCTCIDSSHIHCLLFHQLLVEWRLSWSQDGQSAIWTHHPTNIIWRLNITRHCCYTLFCFLMSLSYKTRLMHVITDMYRTYVIYELHYIILQSTHSESGREATKRLTWRNNTCSTTHNKICLEGTIYGVMTL